MLCIPAPCDSSRDSSPHHPRGYGGGRGGRQGGSHSPSQGRTASPALASCLLGGSGCGHPRWLHGHPRRHQPPLLPWARPAAGAGGKDGGMRAWWTFLAPSRPRSLQRRGRMGRRVTYLLPGIASSRGLHGGFELGRVQVPPHPSASKGSRVLQGRIWGSRAAGRAVLQAQGQLEAAALGQGCQGQVKGQGQGGPPLPPARHSPPPLPLWAGKDRHRSAAMRYGGAGQTVSGAPRSTGARQPVCRPAGGGGGS